jgi:hypothetical protein
LEKDELFEVSLSSLYSEITQLRTTPTKPPHRWRK